MSNLDLSIAKIMHGDTPVLKIMQGDTKVWPSGADAIIDASLTNITSSVALPAVVDLNTSFTVTLTANTSCIINQVTIIMGGNDITSSAYSNGVITISNVTDDVIITASAVEVITFADATVKQICVSNWGGGVIAGEITPEEAASVTNIGIDKNGDSIANGAGPFYNNKDISYFNEFRYFTGITGDGIYWKNTGSNVSTYRGKFALCSLKELTIPAIPTISLAGNFYYCSELEEIDMSNLVHTGTSEGNRRLSVMFQGCVALKKVIFPSHQFVVDSTYRTFGYSSSNGCSNLEYVDFKNLDFSTAPISSSTPANVFQYCTKLAHLPSGMYNLKHSQNFSYNPLTHDSAVALLNSIGTVSGQTITFKATTYDTLSSEEIAIGTAKGWSIVSA